MGTGQAQCYPGAVDENAAQRREELVMEHLPQVRFIARRIHEWMPPNVSLEDLVSAGVLGLIAAIDNFNPSMNVQLNTYAERRIRGAIMDSLRESDWAPRDTRKKARAIEAAIHAAKQRLGREPAEEEIAAELKISHREYQNWLTGMQAIDIRPLEYVSADGEESSLLRFVADPESNWPSQIVERAELERVLARALERMPKQERTVLSLYYYEELTLAEIAQIMGFHLSRIGQLRVQGVLRLRSHMERVWSLPRGRQQ